MFFHLSVPRQLYFPIPDHGINRHSYAIAFVRFEKTYTGIPGFNSLFRLGIDTLIRLILVEGLSSGLEKSIFPWIILLFRSGIRTDAVPVLLIADSWEEYACASAHKVDKPARVTRVPLLLYSLLL